MLYLQENRKKRTLGRIQGDAKTDKERVLEMQSKTPKFSQLQMLNTNYFSSDKEKKRKENQTKTKSEMQCKLQSQLKYQW